jgi:hypothetical protein
MRFILIDVLDGFILTLSLTNGCSSKKEKWELFWMFDLELPG